MTEQVKSISKVTEQQQRLDKQLCNCYSLEYSQVTKFEVSPFTALLNLLKSKYETSPEIFKTVITLLLDYDPTSGDRDDMKAKTIRCLKVLLEKNVDLAECLISMLPESPQTAANTQSYSSPLTALPTRVKQETWKGSSSSTDNQGKDSVKYYNCTIPAVTAYIASQGIPDKVTTSAKLESTLVQPIMGPDNNMTAVQIANPPAKAPIFLCGPYTYDSQTGNEIGEPQTAPVPRFIPLIPTGKPGLWTTCSPQQLVPQQETDQSTQKLCANSDTTKAPNPSEPLIIPTQKSGAKRKLSMMDSSQAKRSASFTVHARESPNISTNSESTANRNGDYVQHFPYSQKLVFIKKTGEMMQSRSENSLCSLQRMVNRLPDVQVEESDKEVDVERIDERNVSESSNHGSDSSNLTKPSVMKRADGQVDKEDEGLIYFDDSDGLDVEDCERDQTVTDCSSQTVLSASSSQKELTQTVVKLDSEKDDFEDSEGMDKVDTERNLKVKDCSAGQADSSAIQIEPVADCERNPTDCCPEQRDSSEQAELTKTVVEHDKGLEDLEPTKDEEPREEEIVVEQEVPVSVAKEGQHLGGLESKDLSAQDDLRMNNVAKVAQETKQFVVQESQDSVQESSQDLVVQETELHVAQTQESQDSVQEVRQDLVVQETELPVAQTQESQDSVQESSQDLFIQETELPVAQTQESQDSVQEVCQDLLIQETELPVAQTQESQDSVQESSQDLFIQETELPVAQTQESRDTVQEVCQDLAIQETELPVAQTQVSLDSVQEVRQDLVVQETELPMAQTQESQDSVQEVRQDLVVQETELPVAQTQVSLDSVQEVRQDLVVQETELPVALTQESLDSVQEVRQDLVVQETELPMALTQESQDAVQEVCEDLLIQETELPVAQTQEIESEQSNSAESPQTLEFGSSCSDVSPLSGTLDLMCREEFATALIEALSQGN